MMLTACASAGKPAPSPADLPPAALRTQVERELVCPAELAGEIPARVQPPAGAVIHANDLADDYLEAKDRREDQLEARLQGAKAVCDARQILQ